MSWNFSVEPAFEEKLEWMRQFINNEVIPLETLRVDSPTLDRLLEPLKAQVKAQGLWATHLPKELGGGGFGQVKLALMHEIIGRSIDLAPYVFGNQAPDSGNSELLARGCRHEWQKEKWLYPLLDGRSHSAFSMTERDAAGSDPLQLATTATLDGNEWVINGRKWFTSNASIATFLIVFVKTDPEAEPYGRYSMIVVPRDTPGLTIVRDINNMADPHGPSRVNYHGHSEVLYENVRVPFENLIGERGQGFALAQTRLGPARTHLCMRWLGQAQRALDMMCERAVSRTIAGGKLADQQFVQGFVAEAATRLWGARLMVMHTAWLIDKIGARQARKEISMIKYTVSEVYQDVVDMAIQVHGSLGFSCDLPLEAMYRSARAARIVDGPDEVHRSVAARLTLRSYRAADVPTEHIPDRHAAALRRYQHEIAS